MKRIAWISCAALAVCLLTAGAASWWAQHRVDSALAQTAQLQRQVTELNNALLGYTRYTSYLTAGKQTLAEQMKLLAATVVREEGATQIIEKSVLGIASTGVVAITYTAEYAFGFDLRPESYELHATNGGIEVHIHRPALVAAPAVTNLQHRILFFAVGGKIHVTAFARQAQPLLTRLHQVGDTKAGPRPINGDGFVRHRGPAPQLDAIGFCQHGHRH